METLEEFKEVLDIASSIGGIFAAILGVVIWIKDTRDENVPNWAAAIFYVVLAIFMLN